VTLSPRPRRDQIGPKDGAPLVDGEWRPRAARRHGGDQRFPGEATSAVRWLQTVRLGREGGQSAFEAYPELKTAPMPLSEEMV
jgi:hypothetical protein